MTIAVLRMNSGKRVVSCVPPWDVGNLRVGHLGGAGTPWSIWDTLEVLEHLSASGSPRWSWALAHQQAAVCAPGAVPGGRGGSTGAVRKKKSHERG